MAQRRNRPMIMAGSVAIWSGFTALSGTATNFVQLLLYRVGVGIGEAGCSPPAHSLIADYVPKSKRNSALAFYSMGTPIGTLLGLIFGGLIADHYGWRTAFLVAGAPGLIFALLALFTLREPREILKRHSAQIEAAKATFAETVAYLARKRTFWLIAVAAAVKAFIGYGHAPFTGSFFLRNHAAEVAAMAERASDILGFTVKSVGFLGLALGILAGLSGTVGAWFGGWIADKVGQKDIRAHMIAPAVASLVTIPVYIAAVTVPSAPLALCLLAVNAFLATIWYGPVYGTAQSVVPIHMRPTTAAILLFIINLIGLGLGPLAVGIVSDVFNKGLGMGSAEGVRWALIVSASVGLVAFACFWFARKTIREDTVS
jgi:MFS family permease